jgi:hypothetical protein
MSKARGHCPIERKNRHQQNPMTKNRTTHSAKRSPGIKPPRGMDIEIQWKTHSPKYRGKAKTHGTLAQTEKEAETRDPCEDQPAHEQGQEENEDTPLAQNHQT